MPRLTCEACKGCGDHYRTLSGSLERTAKTGGACDPRDAADWCCDCGEPLESVEGALLRVEIAEWSKTPQGIAALRTGGITSAERLARARELSAIEEKTAH